MKQQRCRSWFPLGANVAVSGTPSARPWAAGRTPQDPVERAAARGWSEFGRRQFCVWARDGRLVAELAAPGPGWAVVARCDGAGRTIERVELVHTVEKERT